MKISVTTFVGIQTAFLRRPLMSAPHQDNLWGEHQRARELGGQLISLAQRVQDPDLLLEAHHAFARSQSIAGGVDLICVWGCHGL